MEELLRVLQVASSQDPAGLKQAEIYLKNAETQLAGFYEMLQHVYLDETLDEGSRWVAVIYFKNGIDKYWRKSASK